MEEIVARLERSDEVPPAVDCHARGGPELADPRVHKGGLLEGHPGSGRNVGATVHVKLGSAFSAAWCSRESVGSSVVQITLTFIRASSGRTL